MSFADKEILEGEDIITERRKHRIKEDKEKKKKKDSKTEIEYSSSKKYSRTKNGKKKEKESKTEIEFSASKKPKGKSKEKEERPKSKRKVKTENLVTLAQQYDYIIREYYDIYDEETRKIVVSVSEADKNQVLSSLTNKLYDDIVSKVDEIDFGTIPMSKGDVTKIDNYDRLRDCIYTIKSILTEYRQDTSKNIDEVNQALHNLEMRKDLFMKSYQMNLELPIVIYNTITLSIVSSVSFMISSCIEFIKSPNKDTFDIEVDKVALNKTKDNVLFDNLKKFNQSCRKGQIDKTIDFVIKNRVKNFTGYEVGMVLGGIALIGIILNIIPILRELIYFFYYSRVKVSDYFEIQADLLQMNAYNVESNTAMDKADRTKVVKKQMKIADTFRKIANKIGIDNKSSEVNATKEIAKSSNEKYKYSDLNDSIPDSASSSIF